MQNGVIPKLMSGLNPLMLDSKTLRIEQGICATSGANPDIYMEISENTTLDIGVVGPWGVDRGYAGFVPGWWHLWALGDTTGSKSPCCVLVPFGSGGAPATPNYATFGYNRIRLLPYAVYIKGSSTGMRRQLVVGWPSPCRVIYQDQDTEHELRIWRTAPNLSLAGLIPKEARLAYLAIEGGPIRVRTPGSGDGGFPIRSGEQTTRDIAVSSDRRIDVLGRGKLRVLGWEIMHTY